MNLCKLSYVYHTCLVTTHTLLLLTTVLLLYLSAFDIRMFVLLCFLVLYDIFLIANYIHSLCFPPQEDELSPDEQHSNEDRTYVVPIQDPILDEIQKVRLEDRTVFQNPDGTLEISVEK